MTRLGLLIVAAAAFTTLPGGVAQAQSATQAPSLISMGSCSSSKLSDASGDVNLAFLVDASGKAAEIHTTSADSDSLKPCAKEIIGSSQFHPAMREGKPVQFRMEMRVHVDHR